MAVDWPQHLVDRIASDHWALFIGSGTSAASRNEAGDSPPTWSGLLEELGDLIGDANLSQIATDLIAAREYLPAADHIRHTLETEHNLNQYLRTLKRAVEGPPGDLFQPSSFHQALLALEPRVVFTTNYDKIFEAAASNAYASHTFDSEMLGSGIRRGDDVLGKVHGSTDMIEKVVLTRTDYARLMTEGRHVLDCLRSLALTSTILFVGYSLDDPDIQLILQAVGRGGLDPEAHYLLAPEPESASRIPVFRDSYGVSVLTYEAGNHEEAERALVELGHLVLAERSAAVPQ